MATKKRERRRTNEDLSGPPQKTANRKTALFRVIVLFVVAGGKWNCGKN
jgi:hypothetical protein